MREPQREVANPGMAEGSIEEKAFCVLITCFQWSV